MKTPGLLTLAFALAATPFAAAQSKPLPAKAKDAPRLEVVTEGDVDVTPARAQVMAKLFKQLDNDDLSVEERRNLEKKLMKLFKEIQGKDEGPFWVSMTDGKHVEVVEEKAAKGRMDQAKAQMDQAQAQMQRERAQMVKAKAQMEQERAQMQEVRAKMSKMTADAMKAQLEVKGQAEAKRRAFAIHINGEGQTEPVEAEVLEVAGEPRTFTFVTGEDGKFVVLGQDGKLVKGEPMAIGLDKLKIDLGELKTELGDLDKGLMLARPAKAKAKVMVVAGEEAEECEECEECENCDECDECDECEDCDECCDDEDDDAGEIRGILVDMQKEMRTIRKLLQKLVERDAASATAPAKAPKAKKRASVGRDVSVGMAPAGVDAVGGAAGLGGAWLPTGTYSVSGTTGPAFPSRPAKLTVPAAPLPPAPASRAVSGSRYRTARTVTVVGGEDAATAPSASSASPFSSASSEPSATSPCCESTSTSTSAPAVPATPAAPAPAAAPKRATVVRDVVDLK